MEPLTVSRRAVTWTLLALAALLAGPTVALAQDATPAPAATDGPIAAMLARVPATLPGLDDPGLAFVSVADLAGQLEALGLTPPESPDAPDYPAWQAVTRGLALPPSPGPGGLYTREAYGFDLLQADQTVSIEAPPFHLSILVGRFDTDAVRATLEAAGFAPEEVGGHELLALRDDYEMDVRGPDPFRMANMNVVAFLPDGAIAFASARAPLVAVLDVATGAAPTMLDAPGVADLLAAAPDDLVAASIVPGTALAGGIPGGLIDAGLAGGTPDIDAIATEIAATSEMPPILLALLGSTAGGPVIVDDAPLELPPGTPDARAIAIALLATPEMAADAATVAEARLASGGSYEGTPWAEMFPAATVTAVPDAPVLVVDLSLAPGVSRAILLQLIYSRDLSFLAW